MRGRTTARYWQTSIDGVGHLPNLEAQDEFNDILQAFLRARAPG